MQSDIFVFAGCSAINMQQLELSDDHPPKKKPVCILEEHYSHKKSGWHITIPLEANFYTRNKKKKQTNSNEEYRMRDVITNTFRLLPPPTKVIIGNYFISRIL